jgi:hypothetical protein
MSIKQNGGVFGRNPTFNDVTIEGQLTFDGDIDINSDLKVSGAVEATTLYASTSVAVGNPANYQATFYMPGANANYVQVANGVTGASAGNGILYGIDASGNGVFNKQGTGDLITTVAGVERLRILQAGTFDVSAANIAFDSGYGIDFSATAGTGTSELLDDYEEGVFSPTYTPTTGTFTAITVVGTGRYTKVGRLVTLFASIRTSGALDVTGASGNLKITGLPFACNATIAGGGPDLNHQGWNLGTDIVNTRMVVPAGTSEILLYKNTMNGSSFPSGNITVTEMSTAGGSFANLISFTASYEV